MLDQAAVAPGGALRECRIRPRCGGRAAVRVRWHAGRGGGGDRAHGANVLQGARATRLQVFGRRDRAASASGPAARTHFRRRVAPRLPTTAPTAPFHASTSAACSSPSRPWSCASGCGCPNVFHAGDGNLHPLVLFDDGDPDSVARAEAFGAEILEESLRLGGTITGEHGVGMEKLNQMCSQFDRRGARCVPRRQACLRSCRAC